MELIVTAAGEGSRFTKAGINVPKPLIEYRGKPLFWWSAMSALSSGAFTSIKFVVLKDHIEKYSIDKSIRSYFPAAEIQILAEVTSGAAETAAIGCEGLSDLSPVAFLDCDLAFLFEHEEPFSELLKSDFSAGLCVFKSDNPSYSYAIFNLEDSIIGTIEKEVVSPFAIAGLYLFKSASDFLQVYREYKNNCNYSELFMSGVYNLLVLKNKKICKVDLSSHLSLGTPEELSLAKSSLLKFPFENHDEF
jgi:dTDP-glucose pyrophosphorylase